MTRLTAPRMLAGATAILIAALLFFAVGSAPNMLGAAFGGVLLIFLYVAFWAAILAGGIWLAREMGLLKALGESRTKDDALALLDRRYANGEISRSEYFQIKQDLEAGS